MGRICLDDARDRRAHGEVLDERQEGQQIVRGLRSIGAALLRPAGLLLGSGGSCHIASAVETPIDASIAPAVLATHTAPGVCASSRSRLLPGHHRTGGRHGGHGHRSIGRDRRNVCRFRTTPPVRRLVDDLLLFDRAAAHGTADGNSVDPYPSDVRHRLAADETAFIEEPCVFAMELLIAVVRQDGRVCLLGDAQDEPVAAADRASRRSDERVRLDLRLELWHLFRIDPMPERGIDHHRHQHVRMVRTIRRDRFVELLEAGHGSAFCGQIGAVDDDV